MKLPFNPRQTAGFTLIELMVVISIIAGVIAMSMPYLNNRNSKIKSALRELTVLSRELHTKAKLQGAVYRLVIDMQGDAPDGKQLVQTYWVERANGKTVVKATEEAEAFERSKETDEAKRKDPRGFEMDKSMIKAPRQLPDGMRFEKVELSRLKGAISHGKAYIHYMPEGLVDEAAIHVRGEKSQAWTLAIHPLTGKAELISKPVSLQDIKSQ